MWNETVINYVHDRVCRKYSPWECSKCPLEKWNGCKIGLMINDLKEWAEKNISKDVIEAKMKES